MSGEFGEDIPQFGAFDPIADYELRLGGYAVIVNEEDELLVVKTPKGIFLPGGAIEEAETLEAAAIRETEEECGLRIHIDRNIGTADELVRSVSKGKNFRKRCTFFTANVVGNGLATELDHQLLWLAIDDAMRQLKHESQVWAIRRTEDRFFERG